MKDDIKEKYLLKLMK